ncbi:hypothetical protein MRB53_021418 [Persea americana]|uniref:Uncharacterized protein n=1 Tax=Persea americana TaxID=3435 RepID=A0ACC2L3Y3_PERAE|nr:hypothetical protein MRB53_021418 [Persea americana]
MYPTPKKKKIVCQEDRISNLADDILVHILSFSRAKDAVRTSILSTRWRYLWTLNPSLDFSFCKHTDIDRCLQLHRAPKLRSIKYGYNHYQLQLRYNIVTAETEALNRWLRYSATHGVEELLLCHYRYCKDYPVSLFECQSLLQLTLRYGTLNLPVNLCGFKSLVTLCLECKGCKPSCSDFPHLRKAYLRPISFDRRWNGDLDLECWRRMLSAITCVRTLFAGYWLFQKPESRKHLPIPFHDHFVFINLTKLDVDMKYKESNDYLASFISLLKASPALETVCLEHCRGSEWYRLCRGLEQDRCDEYDEVMLWLKQIQDPVFSHHRLKRLTLKGFLTTKTELLLLKFLLEKTIALELLFLVLYRKMINSEPELLKNELTLHKASPNAEIIIS